MQPPEVAVVVAGRSAVACRPVVLIAEDDPIVRELLQELLEIDLGAEVHAASGGVELLRQLEEMQSRPALILLDMVMPDVDGYEIARSVRRDPRLTDTPIIAVTAQNRRDAMLAAGCRAVVEKPFQIDELVRVVRDALAPP